MLVGRDLDEVVLDVHENPVQLVRLGDLNELLTEVIGELVDHEDVEEVDQDIQKLFTEVEVASLRLLVDFLLESPAALMFFRESKSILDEELLPVLLILDLFVDLVELRHGGRLLVRLRLLLVHIHVVVPLLITLCHVLSVVVDHGTRSKVGVVGLNELLVLHLSLC